MKKIIRKIVKELSFKKDWKVIFSLFMVIILAVALFKLPVETVNIPGEQGSGIHCTITHVAIFFSMIYFAKNVIDKAMKVW